MTHLHEDFESQSWHEMARLDQFIQRVHQSHADTVQPALSAPSFMRLCPIALDEACLDLRYSS